MKEKLAKHYTGLKIRVIVWIFLLIRWVHPAIWSSGLATTPTIVAFPRPAVIKFYEARRGPPPASPLHTYALGDGDSPRAFYSVPLNLSADTSHELHESSVANFSFLLDPRVRLPSVRFFSRGALVIIGGQTLHLPSASAAISSI